jgi:prepilin peptidase CpaA
MTIIVWLFCSLVVLAAIQDVAQLKISNAFPIAIIALFGAWLSQTGLEADLWQNLVMFAIVLGFGILLFAKGWLGGGDVKLLAAIALWFDLDGGLSLVVWTLVGGGLLALIFMAVRRMLPARLTSDGGLAALKKKGPIPYGIAIAAGAVFCAQTAGFNPSGRFTLAPIDLQGMSAKLGKEAP